MLFFIFSSSQKKCFVMLSWGINVLATLISRPRNAAQISGWNLFLSVPSLRDRWIRAYEKHKWPDETWFFAQGILFCSTLCFLLCLLPAEIAWQLCSCIQQRWCSFGMSWMPLVTALCSLVFIGQEVKMTCIHPCQKRQLLFLSSSPPLLLCACGGFLVFLALPALPALLALFVRLVSRVLNKLPVAVSSRKTMRRAAAREWLSHSPGQSLDLLL